MRLDSTMTVDNTTYTHFINNTATSGNHIYMDIPTSCNEFCRDEIIVNNSYDIVNHNFTDSINMLPNKLVLREPAVCISNGNNCDTKQAKYLIMDIMLGQEIMLDACVLELYGKNATATQFLLRSSDRKVDPEFVLISCNRLQGIKLQEQKVCNSSVNISLIIKSLIDSQTESKKISVELIAELSPCHPGFYYNSASQRCECYNDDTDILSCSDDHTSVIKRSYWFGARPGTSCNCIDCVSTVSECPNNYCNFSCCETANGYQQPSPERRNQCNSHRSGTACGSCEQGYALSFDSIECVNTSECTAGWTSFVILFSMMYLIVIVILVFILTYYHIGIGYLYAITYYYSMLDIVLSHNLYQSKGLR